MVVGGLGRTATTSAFAVQTVFDVECHRHPGGECYIVRVDLDGIGTPYRIVHRPRPRDRNQEKNGRVNEYRTETDRP
jgi:hypothetical protein